MLVAIPRDRRVRLTVALAAGALAFASPAGAVEEVACDFLAASPEDPTRIGRGVPFEEIDAARAVVACENAVWAKPDLPRLHFQLGRALYRAGEHERARGAYGTAAERGHLGAMNNLAIMLRDGRGGPRDTETARRWFEKAAAADFTPSMTGLGNIFLHGTGVPVDHAKALHWLERAAGRGDALAMGNLGLMHEKGFGIPTDAKEAARLYGEAARLGDANAMNNLGALHINGTGVSEDYGRARELFAAAAAKGHAGAMYHLAIVHEEGYGIPVSIPEAVRWYEAASAAGHPRAPLGAAYLIETAPGGSIDADRVAHFLLAGARRDASEDTREMVERGFSEWGEETRKAIARALVAAGLDGGPGDGTFDPRRLVEAIAALPADFGVTQP